MAATHSHTLRVDGAELRVETWTEPGKLRNHARLLVDGAEVERDAAEEIGEVKLGDTVGHPTTVSWWWTGRVAGVALIEPGSGPERHRRLSYAPPPGTRAARLHAWSEQHPRLWATRHVAAWAGGTLAVLLGINLFFRYVVSWVADRMPALPSLPSLPLPDAPQWWTDLTTWVGQTVSWLAERLLGWIPDEPWLKVVVGGLIALGITVREARRRDRRRRQDPPPEEA